MGGLSKSDFNLLIAVLPKLYSLLPLQMALCEAAITYRFPRLKDLLDAVQKQVSDA